MNFWRNLGTLADKVLPAVALGFMIVLPGIAGFMNIFVYKEYDTGFIALGIMVAFIYWAIQAWKRKEI